MSSEHRRVATDALLSALAFFLSVAMGLYVYRLLWGSLTPSEFASWFLIFEISQFLLLFDFGFTHKFILECGERANQDCNNQLDALRFVLLLAAVGASTALLAVAGMYGEDATRLQSSYLLLSLAIGFTLLSYAETAALRVNKKNKEISILTIGSQVFFAITLSFFSDNMPFAIGMAVFVRSAFLYIAQIVVLAQGYSLRWAKSGCFSGDALAINIAYFSLFMLDVAVFNMARLSVAEIASCLVVKKYFDMLRALWDSILPNLYTRFKVVGSGPEGFALILICFCSYAMAALLAGRVIPAWIVGFSTGWDLYLAFGLSFFGVTLFRIASLKKFYRKQPSWVFVITVVVATKSTFSMILLFGSGAVSVAYLVQGVLLVIIVGAVDFKLSRSAE